MEVFVFHFVAFYLIQFILINMNVYLHKADRKARLRKMNILDGGGGGGGGGGVVMGIFDTVGS